MRLALRILASIVLGIVLLFPLSAVYEAAHLPVYHSWGMLHGSFTTAISALVAASFVSLGLIPWFGPVVDPAPRAVASLAVLPLVTVLFWVREYSHYAIFSVWHAALYGAVFCLLALLCLKSRKPAVVPLFLLLPFLIDPVLDFVVIGLNGLAITGGSRAGILQFALDLLSPALPVLLASCAALAVVRYARARTA